MKYIINVQSVVIPIKYMIFKIIYVLITFFLAITLASFISQLTDIVQYGIVITNYENQLIIKPAL